MSTILSKLTATYVISAAVYTAIEYHSETFAVAKLFISKEMQDSSVSMTMNDNYTVLNLNIGYLNHLEKLRCAEISCLGTSVAYGVTWPVALASQLFLGKRPSYITDTVSKNISEITGKPYRFC